MSSSFRCFLELLRRECILFFKDFVGKLIDSSIFLATTILVFGYFISTSGIEAGYGQFVFIGCVASFGLFEVIWRATTLVIDITGDRVISNFLILPLPANYVLASTAIGWAIGTSIVNICLFPIGLLILFGKFDFSQVSVVKFILIFILGNLFFGFFALWIASLIKNIRKASWLWARVVNPIFMFGGFFYSWQMAYEMSHWVAYANLVNPVLYVLEASRASVLGQGEYLPYWTSFFVILAFTVFFLFDGIRRLKKRLDCV